MSDTLPALKREDFERIRRVDIDRRRWLGVRERERWCVAIRA
ncbi:hypothetical protein [Halorientalis sp.]|nr:hypothetical protein [Halorientalis sp.]